jgi:type VI secretion system protein ImpE
MNAHELFKSGNLSSAIEAQTDEVRAAPGDQDKRLFLFELLAFAGDLDRAQRAIDALHYDDLQTEAARQGYRQLLDAERKRRQTFAQLTPPAFFESTPEHATTRLAALQELRGGRPAEAVALLQKADQQVPAVQGVCNDRPFQGLRDGDDCLGSVLEVMARGNYYWVPFEQIQSLKMNPPRFPRDLLWAPAHLEMRAAGAGEVFLPALYPGSHEATEPAAKLGRRTDWREGGPGPVTGIGAKTFLVGDEAMSILEWRQLDFN